MTVALTPEVQTSSAELFVRTPAAAERESFDLVIAIPTYNRSEQLASLLEQLAAESRSVPGRMLIAVSNNDSTDRTMSVLSDYAIRYADVPFEAYAQPNNIHAIPNIHFLVRAARGAWVWCVGDDDLLIDGALKRVLEALPKVRGQFLLVRVTGITEWASVLAASGLQYVDAATDQGARLLMGSGFLASVLFKTSVWQGLLQEAESFNSSNFANWAAVLIAAVSSGVIPFFDETTVHGNANRVGGERFPRYPILVIQRLNIWRRLRLAGGASSEIASRMRPHMASMFYAAWRGVACGSERSLDTVGDRLRGFHQGLRLLGTPALLALPWLIIAVSLPLCFRTTLTALRRRIVGHTRA